jgi:MFS family permease
MHSTTAAPPARAKGSGLLINRNYGLLWFGQTVSFFGDFIFNTTLVVWIGLQLAANQTWAPLAVSGVLVAAALPVLLVGPVAGVLVDRADKRRTMLVVSVLQGLLVAALLLATGILPLPFLDALTGRQDGTLPLEWQLGAIYAIVFLVNACAQFFNPATVALIGDIVPEANQARANGLFQVSASLAILLGPAIAPPLLLAFGPQWALVIDALSFVVGFAALLAIRAPRSTRSVAKGERGHFLRELGAGIRFTFGNRVLATLIIAVTIAMLGFGALNALDVFFVTQNLHASGELYGLASSAVALGTLIGAIVASALAERVGLIRMLWITLAGMGVAMIVWSRMTDFGPALGVLAVAGLLQSGLNVPATTLLLRVTPKELVGRAIAIIQPVMTLATLVATALAGYLASGVLQDFHAQVLGASFGPIDTILGAAGILAVIGGLFAGLRLWHTELPRQSPADAPAEAPVESASRDGAALALGLEAVEPLTPVRPLSRVQPVRGEPSTPRG